jgi:hypothetical protein
MKGKWAFFLASSNDMFGSYNVEKALLGDAPTSLGSTQHRACFLHSMPLGQSSYYSWIFTCVANPKITKWVILV